MMRFRKNRSRQPLDVTNRARGYKGHFIAEALEPRRLLTAVSWIAASSGDFDNPANWSTGLVPGPGDDVTINAAAGVTVTHSAGTDSINSLTTSSPVVLSGGTLNVATTLQLSSNFTLSGGTLGNATISGTGSVVVASTGTLSGITENGTLDLTQANGARVNVVNGLALNGTALVGSTDGISSGSIHFIGAATQSLSGSGEIRFGANSANGIFNDSSSSGTLTIGSGILIDGASGSVENAVNSNTITLGARINADTAGGTIIITGGHVQETGILGASDGGAVTVNGFFDLGSTNVIDIGIGPDGAGQYNVTQTAVLAGTVNVSLLNGFIPTQGTVYTIGTYGSATGSFGFTGLTSTGVTLTPATTSKAVTLTVTQGAAVTTPPVEQIGGLDPTFGTNGLASHNVGFTATNGLFLQPNGQSVLVGSSTNGSASIFSATRYNADGSIDTSFGNGGVVTAQIGSTSDVTSSGAILPNGDVLIVGIANTLLNGQVIGSQFGLVAFTSAGVLDTSFGNGTGEVLTSFSSLSGTLSNDTENAVKVAPNGTIYLGGSSDAGGQGLDFAVAAYNEDGSPDTAFNTTGRVLLNFPGGDASIGAIDLQSNGDIVAAGSTTNSSTGVSQVALARFLHNGTLDPKFGSKGKVVTTVGGIDDAATAVAIGTNQEIYVAGYTATGSPSDGSLSSNFLLQRYTTAGVLDRTFGTKGTTITSFGQPSAATRVLVAADGSIVVSGKTTASLTSLDPTMIDIAIARYTAKGQPDLTFNGTGQVILGLGSSSASPDFARPFEVEAFAIDPFDTASTLLDEFNQLVSSDQGVLAETTGGELLVAGNSGGNTVEAAIVSNGVDLAVSLLTALPSSTVGGTKSSLSIKIVESGNQTAVGAATIDLFTSTGPQPTTGQSPFGVFSERLNLRAGQARTFRLPFTFPSPLQSGIYQLLAMVNLTGQNDLNASNNVAAAPVDIARPFVQLSGQSFAAPAFVGTKPSSVTLDITNAGNVLASGSTTVQFVAVTTGTTATSTPLVTLALRPSLKPGATHVFLERFALPADLAAGTYVLVAMLDPANVLKQPFPAEDILTSSTTFTVS